MIPVIAAVVGLIVLAGIVRIVQSGDVSLADSAGHAIKPLIVPLVELINKPTFVYFASVLIVLSAIVLIVAYLRRVVAPESAAIRRAEVEIGVLPPVKAGDWRAALAEIDAVLARHGVLASAWASFVQRATETGRLPSRRFADYAREDSSSPINRQGGLMAALPSYYTSIGLILTFVGLVVALYFAARGFRSGDMNEARQSIIQLLNASAFKFLTSVAALISAFMVSVAHRAATSRLRRQIYLLVAAIDQRLQPLLLSAPPEMDAPNRELAQKLDLVVQELILTRGAIETLVARQSERAG